MILYKKKVTSMIKYAKVIKDKHSIRLSIYIMIGIEVAKKKIRSVL